MGRLTGLCAFVAASLVAPSFAHAGGREFPGDGTRAMGRGGAAMTRADSPRAVTRNPAVLADLPSTILEINHAITAPDACFQASGGYGLQVGQGSALDIVQFQGEDEPLILGNGSSIDGYFGEPYPEVCYRGGYTFLPSVLVGGKISRDLGWSFGFVPPDNNQLAQWSDRDGTVQTANGRRPSPTRYTGVHQNATFFSLQGGVGYRLNSWLRIGAGLRWSMVVFQGATFGTALLDSRKASNDGYGEMTGRDLFIPGFNVSAHMIPADNLDVAIGFRWEDSMRVTNPKLDVTTNVWGPGGPVEYEINGVTQVSGAGIPFTTHDIGGTFDAPPLIVPQLSFSLRYADRIISRREQEANPDPTKVGDSLDTERWDVELDGIYYMSSLIEQQVFTFRPGEGQLTRIDANADGSIATLEAVAGKCLTEQLPNGGCPIPRQNIRPLGGRNQWTFRLGTDINVLPSRFAVRAGISYEQRGVDPNQVFTGNSSGLQRTGLHLGFTLRSGRTDFTLSYAHFETETLEIAFSRPERPSRFDEPEYHPISEGDAAAYAELPDNDNSFGSASVNAGRHTQSLDVVAIGLAQHF